MRPYDEQSRDGSLALEENRLETPAMIGYRRGMSSCGVIGRRLNSVYCVQRDLPREMDNVIRELQTKLGRSR